jgi:hypothetical protein
MSEGIAYHELLARVAAQLLMIPSTTDHLMLTKWRVLSMCQHLLSDPEQELEDACREALQAFAASGPCDECVTLLEAASAVLKRVKGTAESVPWRQTARPRSSRHCSYSPPCVPG